VRTERQTKQQHRSRVHDSVNNPRLRSSLSSLLHDQVVPWDNSKTAAADYDRGTGIRKTNGVHRAERPLQRIFDRRAIRESRYRPSQRDWVKLFRLLPSHIAHAAIDVQDVHRAIAVAKVQGLAGIRTPRRCFRSQLAEGGELPQGILDRLSGALLSASRSVVFMKRQHLICALHH